MKYLWQPFLFLMLIFSNAADADSLRNSNGAVIPISPPMTPFDLKPQPVQSLKWPDCYCRYSDGSRKQLGDIVCIQIGNESFSARCEMALNNPHWRRIGDECPIM